MVKSDCLPEQAAIASNRKLASASISQLHKTVLLIKTYGWLGIWIGMLLVSLQITCILFGQFANTISCPPSRTAGSHLCYWNNTGNHNFLLLFQCLNQNISHFAAVFGYVFYYK